MKTIEQTVTFDAKPLAVYNLYMDAKKHAAAIGGAVKVAKRVGSKFSAWDDYCWGKILHFDPGTLIVQTWRASDWKKSDPDSILILHFEGVGGKTRLRMVHANVPDAHATALGKGWKEHYWEPFAAALRGT
jgi:activator of HSP90 ATPase